MNKAKRVLLFFMFASSAVAVAGDYIESFQDQKILGPLESAAVVPGYMGAQDWCYECDKFTYQKGTIADKALLDWHLGNIFSDEGKPHRAKATDGRE